MTIPSPETRDFASLRINRRVLIVTDDVDGSVGMVEHLRALMLGVKITTYDGDALQNLPFEPPSAVLCFLSDYIEKAPEIVAQIRAHYAPRDFPILGRLMRKTDGDHPFDSVLYAPVHPVQVAHRMASLIRLGQMEAEIIRRMETMRDSFGESVTLSPDINRAPFQILFIGKADPAYMAVVNALQNKNAEVVAAFTSFSAFDYLHDRRFDAVVMNARGGNEPAMTISDTMRRNPRLTHVPTLLLIDEEGFQDEDMAYRHGVNDLIDSDACALEISGRILELANSYRLHEKLKSDFSDFGTPSCMDQQTAVFNKAFFTAHLKRVSQECREQRLPLSILTIKLKPQADGSLAADVMDIALSKCIRLVAGIVRMQDIVARLDRDMVAVAFPEERRGDVEIIAGRIRELIANAAFDTPHEASGALTLRAETDIVEQVLPPQPTSVLAEIGSPRQRRNQRARPRPVPHADQSGLARRAQHPEPST